MRDLRGGQEGVGRTVFSGSEIEEFGVEILGVLENAGPRQSIILGHLSGGPLERTGVLQGMSGSPVYIDGKLVGAVALAFPFTSEPIAGIRPIEEMLRRPANPVGQPIARASLLDRRLTSLFPEREEFLAAGGRLTEIATPVSFSGMTQRTIEEFAPELRAIGLEPRAGLAGGGSAGPAMGAPESVKPGSMISVLLLTGDMMVGADGTVTHVDGSEIYAFGHRFLSVGSTELPFTRSEVITLAPNLSTSFKISASRETLGAITADYSTAVAGELGRRAAMVPVAIKVFGHRGNNAAERLFEYGMEMVNDRYLAPFLLQMAVYSAIDATERTLGASSIALSGEITFDNGVTPIRLDDMYAGDGNVPRDASLGAAIPMAYLLQSGFDDLRLKGVTIEIRVFDERRLWQVDQVWPDKQKVRPGEELELSVVLIGDNGQERVHRAKYQVPVGAPEGTLNITVADAMTVNLSEYRHLADTRQRSSAQVVTLLNELRRNTSAYVRLWRYERGYTVQGHNLPAPPASVSLLLGRAQPAVGGASLSYSSKIAEIPVGAGDAVITGSKTIQVEVAE